MTEILSAGGSAYLIPAVLFILMLYVARGLFGLHGRRSQHRKEFLELWSNERAQDDLWLEVVVRHLCGTYLPAHIIRLAFKQPEKTQSLFDLAELWPLFHFDADSNTANWTNRRHNTVTRRRLGRLLLRTGYFACALMAAFAAIVAAKLGPGTLAGWVYGVTAVITGLLALLCLMREDTLKTAATVGDYWLLRINRHAANASPPGATSSHCPGTATEQNAL